MDIELLDVSPRDGLQNEGRVLATDVKVALIRRLVADSTRRIEVTSFVDPRRVPQMADAEAVVAATTLPGLTRIGLVLNRRGADRALATGIEELSAVCVASDAFGHANQRQNAAQSVDTAVAIIAAAQAAGRRAQATIAVAFGCPFSGPVDPAFVVATARILANAGAMEVAIADTIGVAVPSEVTRLVEAVRAAIAPVPVRVHFHDTRGTGIANVWAAVQAGAGTIDAAVGGVGGCPFAPGSAGNVASEDVAYLLARSGLEFGRDAAAMAETGRWLCGQLGRSPASRMASAPDYPTETA